MSIRFCEVEIRVEGGILDGQVIRRRVGEWITIADGWRVFVGKIGTFRCKLGFDVPRDVDVKRLELRAA